LHSVTLEGLEFRAQAEIAEVVYLREIILAPRSFQFAFCFGKLFSAHRDALMNYIRRPSWIEPNTVQFKHRACVVKQVARNAAMYVVQRVSLPFSPSIRLMRRAVD
jgi:hypothetical protein